MGLTAIDKTKVASPGKAWDEASAFDTAPGFSQPDPKIASAWGPAASRENTSTPAPNTGGPQGRDPMATSPAAQVITGLGVAPVATTSPLGKAPDWTAAIAKMTSAFSPQDALLAQDQLARDLQQKLTAAGHKVSWDGNQLTVDGRPYNIGPAPGATTSPTGPSVGQGVFDQAVKTQQETVAESARYNRFGSFDQLWLDSGWKTAAEAQAAVATWNKYHPNDPVELVGHSGDSVRYRGQIKDLIFSVGSPDARGQWIDPSPDTGGDPSGGGPMAGWGDPNAGGAPGGGAAWPGLSVAGSPITDLNSLWPGTSLGQGQRYNPTMLDEGSPELDALTAKLGDPSRYDPSLMNENNPELDALTARIAAHPEVYSQHDIESMQAKDAEEQINAAQSGDRASQRFGFSAGINDSPWLASERAASLRSADQGILSNRRNIELTAGAANAEGLKSSAATLSQAWGQKQGVHALNEQTKRQSSEDLRSAVSTLSQVWNQKQNVHQLNEQMKLQAAQMGLSEDEFVAQLEQHVRDLEQQDAQFGANLGLSYDSLNNNAYNAYWAT